MRTGRKVQVSRAMCVRKPALQCRCSESYLRSKNDKPSFGYNQLYWREHDPSQREECRKGLQREGSFDVSLMTFDCLQRVWHLVCAGDTKTHKDSVPVLRGGPLSSEEERLVEVT